MRLPPFGASTSYRLSAHLPPTPTAFRRLSLFSATAFRLTYRLSAPIAYHSDSVLGPPTMMAAQQPLKDGLEGLRVAWWFRHSQQNEQKTKKVTNSTKRGEVNAYFESTLGIGAAWLEKIFVLSRIPRWCHGFGSRVA